MSDIQIIEAYLGRNAAAYIEMLEEVEAHCKKLQEGPTSGRVYRVYTRGDKQGSQLKDAVKILEKIPKPVTEKNIKALHDIIGVTVVAYYNDDIDVLIARLDVMLQGGAIKRMGDPDNKREGYFAKHLILRSNAGDYRCEVQFKTVLHDAWSAKMHDLTYKPQGAMDDRMGQLMTATGYTLEGLEQQSVTVRNIITGRHALQSRAFTANCDHLFAQVADEGALRLIGKRDAKVRGLLKRIEKLRLSAGNHDQAGEVQKIVAEVDAIGASEPYVKWGWLLMSRLACGGVLGDLSRQTATQVDRFLEHVENTPALMEAELLQYVPIALYVTGDFTRAISLSERMLEKPFADAFSDPSDAFQIEFNRACFRLEREHLRPSRKQEDRDALEVELRKMIFEVKGFEDEGFASGLLDSQGLFKIVFGKTQAEVREGISDCEKSADVAPEHEKALAEACREWRLEAGWRRYFDLVERLI